MKKDNRYATAAISRKKKGLTKKKKCRRLCDGFINTDYTDCCGLHGLRHSEKAPNPQRRNRGNKGNEQFNRRDASKKKL
jgi:hypothetical protein